MPNDIKFRRLVIEMRSAQKAFFRDKADMASLRRAKELERQVDEILKQWAHPGPQLTMFAEEA